MLYYAAERKDVRTENCISALVMIALTVLICLRDILGISVSKYLLAALLAPPLLLLGETNFFRLWAFIMPLYIGLPGNILTAVMLLRFMLNCMDSGEIKIEPVQLVLTVLTGLYIFIQNIITGYTGVYQMIYPAELMLLYFVMTSNHGDNLKDMLQAYTVGVALVGAVMLASTLRGAQFEELMNVGSRLGYLGRTDDMTIIIDPNYYGLFALTVLSVNWLMVSKKKYSFSETLVAFACVSISLFIGLIGLSRAFILSAAAWLFMVILAGGRRKIKLALIVWTALLVIGAFRLMPDTIEVLISRFRGADVMTGNGRLTHDYEMICRWMETPVSMMFGIGLFNCNAHCMQLQFAAGMGIAGFPLIAALYYGYFRMKRRRAMKNDWEMLIPVLIVQLSAATLPVAQSMTFMMPVVISILVYGEANREESNGGVRDTP